MARKQMVTVAEAAEMTGKCERSIRGACQNEVFRAEKVGKTWMIEKASVKEYLKAVKKAEKEKEKAKRLAAKAKAKGARRS